MITVNTAKDLIITNCPVPVSVKLPLLQARSGILAEAVIAEYDTPPFHQSAMDGYAFSYENWDKLSPLEIIGEVKAGDLYNKNLLPGNAVRIFTGAPLPGGTDTVVMQEKVIIIDKKIKIADENLQPGSNVRLKGSQTRMGDVALQKNQKITPAGVSYLAGMGIHEVSVYTKPTIGIIVTGKELVKPGTPIQDGKIFESNSYGLTAALNQIEINPASIIVTDDDEIEIREAITHGLTNDILIITGGVSVGDYDFVPTCLEQCGVNKIFYKVKQKPGKPLYFGKYQNTLVFALPGNPAAVMSCFYEYIIPAISQFTKLDVYPRYSLPLANSYEKKADLTYFLKGRIFDGMVEILNSQESYMLNSFAYADCLVELSEEKEQYNKGEMVTILKIN